MALRLRRLGSQSRKSAQRHEYRKSRWLSKQRRQDWHVRLHHYRSRLDGFRSFHRQGLPLPRNQRIARSFRACADAFLKSEFCSSLSATLRRFVALEKSTVPNSARIRSIYEGYPFAEMLLAKAIIVGLALARSWLFQSGDSSSHPQAEALLACANSGVSSRITPLS